MTEHLKMDKVQPRMLDETGQGAITVPMDRPEGRLKVAGQATYAAEYKAENMAYGVLVRATITKGQVTSIDEGSVTSLPGVLGVFATGKMPRSPAQGTAGAAPIQPEGRVDYFGQPIAVIVAESFEQARHAASNLKIAYEAETAETDPETASEIDVPDGQLLDQGDIEAAMSDAAFTVDATYTTPPHNSAAMEPHASLAEWHGDNLVLHGAYQMLKFNREELADSLGIDPEKVRIHSPYVGGGFGGKLGISQEAIAAAVAARELKRPVRVVMARQQVFEMTMRRTESRQRVRLAADKDGKITGLAHEDRVSNLPEEGFSEPTAVASHFLYGGENRFFRQEVARIHRTTAGSVRAPGEAIGQLALECAMDELAEKTGIDPVQLRIQNIPEKHPESGLPFSSNSLAQCLTDGAERFGWSERKGVGKRREGEWFVGMGVASAARTNILMESRARVTLNPDGTALVETDMTDIGTGTYAILGQIAAEMLGLPTEKVTVELGDTNLPGASGSGGSWGAASAGSSVFLGAKAIRSKIAKSLGCAPEELRLKDGIATGANNRRPLAELMSGPISEEGHIEPGTTMEEFAQSGFGAHFCEVGVNAVTGEVRVRRMLAVFAAGRILNEKTARSQGHGGMIWGIGSALTEAIEHDPRDGRIVNHDFAEYHMPVHLDVPDLDVMFVEELDDHSNPLQSKGIGELGLSGAGAAVANAIYNACGVRVRDYPATPDKIFPHLPE
ncbi:xanthine dehydrogenase YagR molybdenum-binding subunit [Palleronia aestuarii]|uniref:Xanthine dehydrogenase YagR molybdenum-binding subunit n=1 Tax=Palleronia aestuarii TaxID=568105 RepID=A0A2W7NT71_9RHOB|nr:xanthine dehydrogenase family protein molybdopterin-binding subunit [Palleronia aestuarii]PZX16516.1 xanthine dehydrogenase YagR molybdenum-binding subunit [Palleronia aestuarii]